MEFKKAIVREPSRSISEGLSSVGRVPDFKRSLSQHEKYVGALKEAGLDVLVMESEEEYPDSVFVEDTAVLMKELAVIFDILLRLKTEESPRSSRWSLMKRKNITRPPLDVSSPLHGI